MKKISIKSKRAQNWLAAYNASKHICIEQAYAKPSSRKIKAGRECWQRCQQEDGHRFRIISAGAQYFTVAWTVRGGLRVETAYNSYFIEL